MICHAIGSAYPVCCIVAPSIGWLYKSYRQTEPLRSEANRRGFVRSPIIITEPFFFSSLSLAPVETSGLLFCRMTGRQTRNDGQEPAEVVSEHVSAAVSLRCFQLFQTGYANGLVGVTSLRRIAISFDHLAGYPGCDSRSKKNLLPTLRRSSASVEGYL